MRLVVVSHALVQEVPRRRWHLLAERFPVEVHLLVPKLWRIRWFMDEQVFRPKEVHEGRFHVHPLRTTSSTSWGKYLFVSPDAKLRSIQPDIIYVIHEEMVLVHHQMLAYRRLWCPEAKYIFFTMHALGIPQTNWHQRFRWNRLQSAADAAVCHYPGCLASLREGGFSKPVFMQTQIGVDETLFVPDNQDRDSVRRELGLDGRFVIGYTGRLTRDKGLEDLLEALPIPDVDWGLLLVGNGDMREEIERYVEEKGWQDRVRLVGTVDYSRVPRYMRAMDCFVLASRTTPHWIDTFPLVTVQAMACGVPVIGSDSAAIPWQLGDAGLVFPEKDSSRLREKILQLAQQPELRENIAEAGRMRSLDNFCIEGMTERFFDILQQIRSGDFSSDLPKSDQRKAYLE